MVISDLSIPLIMIVFGFYFTKKPPKSINGWFGYRTAMSMKNKDTWEFAHKHIGKTWFRLGLILAILVTGTLMYVNGMDKESIEKARSILVGVEVTVLVVSIFPTEIALIKNFDGNGKKK